MTTSSDLLPIMIVADPSVRSATEAGAAVIVFDPALERVLHANAAGRSILGLSPAQGIGAAPPASAAARQIRSAQRSLAAAGKARILLRGAWKTSSKALVADLSLIEPEGAGRLALLTAAGSPRTFAAADLLADAGLQSHAAAIFRSGDAPLCTDAFGRLAPEGLGTAVAEFEASADDLRVVDEEHRRITLARAAFGHVIALIEDRAREAAVAEPTADAEVDAPAPEMVAAETVSAEPEGAAPTGFSSFSVKRSKLPRGRASMSMSALVERWHSRRPLDEATPPSNPEAAPPVDDAVDAPAEAQTSTQALSAEEQAPAEQASAGSPSRPVGRRSAWGLTPAASDAALDEAPSQEVRLAASETSSGAIVATDEAEGVVPVEIAEGDDGATVDPEALASGEEPDETDREDSATPALAKSDEPAPRLRSIWSAPMPQPLPIAAEPASSEETDAPDAGAPAADADADADAGESDAGLEDGVWDESAEPASERVIVEADSLDAITPAEPHAGFASGGPNASLDEDIETEDADDDVAIFAAEEPVSALGPDEAPDAVAWAESAAENADGADAADVRADTPRGDAASDGAHTSAELVEPEAGAPSALPAPIPVPAAEEAFVPRFDVPPVRFVWQIDRVGHFRFLSPDFAAAVGPKAAAVLGRSFKDVAQVFGFDDTGEIQRLLDRRDTWSGRSILWPVEGSDRKAPVDLAALPVYARDRSFDGFRGFGIVRMNEAVRDDTALGLVLAGHPATVPDVPLPEETAALVPDALVPDAVVPAATPSFGEILAPETAPPGKAMFKTYEADLPGVTFGRRQEPPQPAGEHGANSDDDSEPKVIRLEERRRPKDGVLSQAEEAAFRAIGMKLGSEVRSEAAAPLPLADAATAPRQIVDGSIEASDVEADARTAIETAPCEDTAQTVGDPSEAPASDPARPDETGEAATHGAGTPDRFGEVPGSKETGDDLPPAETADASDEGEDDALLPVAGPDAGSSTLFVLPPSMDLGETGVPDDDGLHQSVQEDVGDAVTSEVVGDTAGEPDAGAHAEAVPDTDGDTPVEVAAIFASLPLPILVQAGRSLVYANREFEDLSGYASVDALEAAGGLGTLFVERDSEPSAGETTVRRSNGQLLDVRAHMQRVTLAGRSFLVMSFSPSPRDSAAAVLPSPAEAEVGDADDMRSRIEDLQAVLDTATDGVVLLDPSGTIRSMNGSAHALFGIGQAESAGRHLSSLFAHESQKATLDYLEMLRDDGIGGILNDGREVIGRVAQGGFIPLFITIGRLSGERGWCVVIRDIAHWKRIEEDLVNARRQAEAASLHKSRFLANISHELRTPLNAIIGFADVMASECFGPINNARYLEYLGDIKRSGHHVLDLVNDLLDISKIEAGKLDLSFEAVSLNEVVSEVVSLMQPQANRERVIVRSNLPSSVPPVVADRRTMRQIALNLVANAIRFTPAGGQIIASTTYTAEGDVLMRFRDSGIGMTEREIEIALTPFQQVHAPSATRGEGTGLGLPLTKAMVEANRAYFAIQSTPGEGTLVEIAFPSQRVLAD